MPFVPANSIIGVIQYPFCAVQLPINDVGTVQFVLPYWWMILNRQMSCIRWCPDETLLNQCLFTNHDFHSYAMNYIQILHVVYTCFEHVSIHKVFRYLVRCARRSTIVRRHIPLQALRNFVFAEQVALNAPTKRTQGSHLRLVSQSITVYCSFVEFTSHVLRCGQT